VQGSNEKTVLEPLASAWGEAAFLHNVIIVHPIFEFKDVFHNAL
jgi:hypothetical protein